MLMGVHSLLSIQTDGQIIHLKFQILKMGFAGGFSSQNGRNPSRAMLVDKTLGKMKKTRPDTRHKMRLVCELFTFKNNTGHTDPRTDVPTDRRTDGHDLI